MLAERTAPGDRQAKSAERSRLASRWRGLRTALLYVLVCVVSFLGVVVLFSVAESLWIGRG